MSEKKTNLVDADDLRPLFKFLGKNWYLILSFPLIAFCIAYLYTYKLPNIYAAKTEILLKSSETYDYQNQIYSNLGYYSLLADITNQQRIMQSYDVVSKTLERVDFDISYYLVGRLTEKQVARFDAFDVEMTLNSPSSPLYNVPVQIKVIDINSFEISYLYRGNNINKVFTFDEYHDEIDYTIRLTRRKGINAETIDGIK
ncbi:MAG: Wzz/FepE/Etk N-terminal domain-containing protein, partial [Flavobacteriales bacterium]|nr:Wzz/FepE/Etk N-terminal domain-containing protein [Flavobacteriales bacterium]